LFLQAIFPLPARVIHDFLADLSKVIVIEENTPMIVSQLKIIAANSQINLLWEVFAHPGEIFRWEISNRLRREFPALVVNEKYIESNAERPILKGNCNDSRYDEVLTLLDNCAKELGKKVNYYGDPGCLVSVSDRLKAKFAMGGSVSTVFGANVADLSILNIALIGDSGFFHSALLSIIDASHQKADIAMILLNNNVAKTTGGQQHPGSFTESDQHATIDYRSLLDSCGVKTIEHINLAMDDDEIILKTTNFLKSEGIRLLQIDINAN
jgi:indolepyruvate ferredoxin oxidoreductase, alpha subunit